jgi:hypothetical protein
MIRRATLMPLATLLLLVSPAVGGCNVSANADATGGVGDVGAAGTCAHGSVVVLTDYASTQVALSALDGTTRSASFLSTASTKTDGLAFALSGDVVVPNTAPTSGRVVLLDRYGTNVITWADPATGKVLAQLPVGTGFESNPQDYVEIDASRAYVTRWGTNGAKGAQPFDAGSDVLLVDTQGPKILASISLPSVEGLPPRPAGMTRVGDTTVVVLQRLAEDFKTQGDSMLVGVRDASVAWQLTLKGLKGCGRPAVAPSGRVLVLSCEGQIGADGSVLDASQAAVVTLDVTSLPPKEVARYPISDRLGDPPQDAVAFASESIVFGKTQTALGGDHDNQVFSLDLRTGGVTSLLRAGKDAHGQAKGIVYGGLRCAPGCGDVCLMADADLGVLQRWHVEGDTVAPLAAVTVEAKVGLPPQGLGAY